MMQPLGASGVLSMFFFFSVWKLDKKKDSESATYQENKFGLCTCYLLKNNNNKCNENDHYF